ASPAATAHSPTAIRTHGRATSRRRSPRSPARISLSSAAASAAASRLLIRARASRRAASARAQLHRHFALTSATVVSSIRFEKPHSLSYQLLTLTRRPETLVSVASKVLDAGLWLKSTDTSGSLVYASTPFIGPSAASFMIALISSTVVSRAATNDRSTIDTLIVGTRIA